MKTTIRTLSVMAATGLMLVAGAGAAHAAPPVAVDDVAQWDPATGSCVQVDVLVNDGSTVRTIEGAVFTAGAGTVDAHLDAELGRPVLSVCPTGTHPGDVVTVQYRAYSLYDEHGQIREVHGEADTAAATVTVTVAGATAGAPVGRVVVMAGVGEPVRLGKAVGATVIRSISAADPAVLGYLGVSIATGDRSQLLVEPPKGQVGEWTLGFVTDAGPGSVVVRVVDPYGPDAGEWTRGAVVPLDGRDAPTSPPTAEPVPVVSASPVTVAPVPAAIEPASVILAVFTLEPRPTASTSSGAPS